MWNKILNKNKKGFTLLEVIVAVFIISVGIGGVANIMPSLISGVSLNQSRLVAAYLAQEGIEIVRNIRDTNWLEAHKADATTPLWDDGLAACSLGCELDYTFASSSAPSLAAYGAGRYLNIIPSGFYGYGAGTQTKYKRKIIIVDNADILTISSEVFWSDRGKSYSFPVQEKIYKWY
jgi:prepilin-type N-terminal cleavage/methylation domain-containing protein